jgi:ferredoxin
MEHRVRLVFDGEDTIDIGCRPNEDVVSAGLRQGVLIVSDCRHGICGACRAFLVEGGYDQLLEHSVHALSDEDEEDGWVLSCRLRPRADLVLEFDYPADRVARLGASRRTARILRSEQCGGGLYRLVVRTMAVQAPLGWIAGQHVLIHQAKSGDVFPAFPADVAGGGLEIDLYLALPHRTHALPLFAEGEMVTLEGPVGEFILRPGSEDLIFLAGTEGLPPAVAMFGSLSRYGDERNTTLIVCDIGLEAEVWLRPLVGTNPRIRFGLDALTEQLAVSHSAQLYLCGPSQLNAAARLVFAGRDAEQPIVWENDVIGNVTRP